METYAFGAIFVALVIPSRLLAAAISSTQDVAGPAMVDLYKAIGDASFLGSDFIYGFLYNRSDVDSSIPDHYMTDIKAEFPEAIISGPSSAHSPQQDDKNRRVWMDAIAQKCTIPDIYSWHQIGVWEREPDTTIAAFNALRADYSLP
ncbi:hypothetical protein B0J13DRAFT_624712 [Dactylonectria estremocensis]|uniref:Uncharacterized protein n=1 Tax=Dactylonectria estremocensis TaxID=1079267 RepID=A0A9P9EKL5_9HYPO|nr:hypothetical protein B0J13DRAFT_624712 [Dactylonectria estremocensis]